MKPTLPMTHPQQQLIAKWRERSDALRREYWRQRESGVIDRVAIEDVVAAIAECADELEAALSAGAVPNKENQMDVEAVSAEVHDAWMASKRTQGVSSRRSESGEELMVPYADLSEPAKDLDRGTVRAVFAAIERVSAGAVPQQEPQECIWTYTAEAFDADVWESACGETWQFLDGGPKENRARYCHGCGKRIQINKGTFSNKDTNA